MCIWNQGLFDLWHAAAAVPPSSIARDQFNFDKYVCGHVGRVRQFKINLICWVVCVLVLVGCLATRYL